MSKVTSPLAFIIWAALLTGGFIFAGFHKDAPFGLFSEWLTGGLVFYISRRLGKFWVGLKYGCKQPENGVMKNGSPID